jgi:hypothetical protein
MRKDAIALLAMLVGPALAFAQDQLPLPGTRYVVVDTDDAANPRMEPSEEASRVTRFADGTILRNIGCGMYVGQGWCEVESVAGGVAGWTSAQLLRPYSGADPAALLSPAVAANSTEAATPGRVNGVLSPATVRDYSLDVAAGTVLTVSVRSIPEGGVLIVFDKSGDALAEMDNPLASASVEFGEATSILLRLVEKSGAKGEFEFDVAVE